MDARVFLELEIDEVVNLFPAANVENRLLPILKTIFGTVVYATESHIPNASTSAGCTRLSQLSNLCIG